MNGHLTPAMADGLPMLAVVMALATAAFILISGSHLRTWRYFSIADLVYIVTPPTLAIVATVVALRLTGGISWLPASVPVIQWTVMLLLLGGMRLTRRVLREQRGTRVNAAVAANDEREPAVRRVLLAGPIDQVDFALRLLEGSERSRYRAVGILDSTGRDFRLKLRGVRVLGGLEGIEDVVNGLDAVGQRPDCIFLVDGANDLAGPDMVRLVNRAESLGISVGSMNARVGMQDKPGRLDLSFIDMADLLGRPQVRRDTGFAAAAITGSRVLVTGAGGTIGSELVRQIAALNPAELTLLDHCEYNLYNIDLEMQENFPELSRRAVLCSIRQRECLMQAFNAAAPDLVFHAAALKHVPLVETNPCAGVLTNVIGTRNVADACRRFKVRAMIQVSTDKAVNPVGLMGATKRLGELYAQALDLVGAHEKDAPRFMTVRFGNVLGSSGSLIPLLQRQLSRRLPLTVTHPDITRYFMTVHEAVHLILQSSTQAVAENGRRGRIFVLDMGQPIKIIDIARRMIRLAGLRPDIDVKIDIVGLRPGEKLYEELFDQEEERLPSSLPGIFEAEPDAMPLDQLRGIFDALEAASLRDEDVSVRRIIAAALDRPMAGTEGTLHALHPVGQKANDLGPAAVAAQ